MSGSVLGIERRSGRRASAALTVHFRHKDRPDEPEAIATSYDVSRNSIGFESKERLDIGATVSMAILLPSASKPIRAEGRVRRVEELDAGDLYFYGVAFQKIDLEDQSLLENEVSTVELDSLLRRAVKQNISDVHLVADSPPLVRMHGELTPMDDPPIPAADLEKLILSMVPDRQRAELEQNLDVDFSHLLPEGVRFRVNVHMERGTMQAALRVIPREIRTVAELGLPPVLSELARKRRGLLIVCGPTGSGKSTTLAAVIDQINRERSCMIISIEDPIEQLHTSRKSVIKQREVGVDTISFASALKHVLRQDPNVIMVGEMRDLESISMAITAAETGHLVLTTLHTSSAAEAINRVVDVYPAHQQQQIRTQISECLEAVVAQTILARKDGKGRVVATEVLVGTPAIRNLIRMGQVEQIASYVVSGTRHGMVSMDDSLAQLVSEGAISVETARLHARNPAKFGG
jgi:twitching motility protein PilT